MFGCGFVDCSCFNSVVVGVSLCGFGLGSVVCAFVNCLFIIVWWITCLVAWWLCWLLLVCFRCCLRLRWTVQIGGLCSLIVLLCATLCSLYFVVLI